MCASVLVGRDAESVAPQVCRFSEETCVCLGLSPGLLSYRGCWGLANLLPPQRLQKCEEQDVGAQLFSRETGHPGSEEKRREGKRVCICLWMRGKLAKLTRLVGYSLALGGLNIYSTSLSHWAISCIKLLQTKSIDSYQQASHNF